MHTISHEAGEPITSHHDKIRMDARKSRHEKPHLKFDHEQTMTVHTTEVHDHPETLKHDAEFMHGDSHHFIHGHVKPIQNPDMHYAIDHPTYASLDHHYDDEHDVTPVPYHDHRVLKSPPFPDA